MRCFSTPDDPCQAVCPACTSQSAAEDWEGWSELDPAIQPCVQPTHCARCGEPLDA